MNSQKRGIPVENARKNWGTLKSTTCFAVTRRLTSLSLSKKLAVKWKYKTNTDGSIQNGGM